MVSIKITDFQWDIGNLDKCQKHGVCLEEIERVLISGETNIIADEKHSDLEKRYIAVGKTVKGRYMFVVFTFRAVRGAVFIRPLGARYMHKKEIENYGKKTT